MKLKRYNEMFVDKDGNVWDDEDMTKKSFEYEKDGFDVGKKEWIKAARGRKELTKEELDILLGTDRIPYYDGFKGIGDNPVYTFEFGGFYYLGINHRLRYYSKFKKLSNMKNYYDICLSLYEERPDSEVLELLKKANINFKLNKNYILYGCCYNGLVECVKYLISKKKEVNPFQNTPDLYNSFSVANRHPEVLYLLIDKYGAPDNTFTNAISSGNVELVKRLLNNPKIKKKISKEDAFTSFDWNMSIYKYNPNPHYNNHVKIYNMLKDNPDVDPRILEILKEVIDAR